MFSCWKTGGSPGGQEFFKEVKERKTLHFKLFGQQSTKFKNSGFFCEPRFLGSSLIVLLIAGSKLPAIP
jgi:hypothetical protein